MKKRASLIYLTCLGSELKSTGAKNPFLQVTHLAEENKEVQWSKVSLRMRIIVWKSSLLLMVFCLEVRVAQHTQKKKTKIEKLFFFLV